MGDVLAAFIFSALAPEANMVEGSNTQRVRATLHITTFWKRSTAVREIASWVPRIIFILYDSKFSNC